MAIRVLVIEDNMDLLETVSCSLRAVGMEVTTARSGREGLERARQEPPEIILTDLMLPQVNGYEICTMLKQDTRYQRIPVIIWSATKILGKDAELAKDCGADAFVLKTISPKELVDKIHEVLATAGGTSPPSNSSQNPVGSG